MAQTRPRFQVVLHQRLLHHVRTPRVVQELRVPVEVVSAIDQHFDWFDDEIQTLKDFTGDINATWETNRPCYKHLGLEGYGGTYRLGRLISTQPGVAQMMNWNRELRDSILAYGYDQFDITHALPTVIFHYFKDLNLPNLDAAIKELDAPTMDRNAIKHVVTRVLQGCNVENTPENLDVMQCEWFDGLCVEARKIHLAMENRYPGFVELCKAKRVKDKKPEEQWPSTAIQIFYNDVESVLQTKAASKLDGALINCDALFVPKTFRGNALEILNELHAGMGIRYVHKPMAQPVNIPAIDIALDRVHGIVAQDAAIGVYGHWKTEFERTNFYLAEKNQFVTLDPDTRALYVTPTSRMIDTRYAYDADNVKAWIADASRLTYRRIVNCPPPQICSPRDFNLWGFSSEFRAATLPELGVKDDMDELVAPVLEMFRRIVSNNQAHFNYLLSYMADSLQNPGIKRAQYIGMFGQQGVGKNELMERFWMDKIIGSDLCATYTSISQWAGPYEDGWQTKMWVMVHEAEYKDFTAHYQFLKGVTGSEKVDSNTKYGAKMNIMFYGRIIMLSNYANAFNEDNVISRRQGLRCVASSFRSVPNALQILRSAKVQRAFYDYLMDFDVDNWDPERDRVDSSLLHDANFLTTFRKEQGNMMMVLMSLCLDHLYERFRRLDDEAEVHEYKMMFTLPSAAIYDAYFELCNFDADEKRAKNAHVVNMAALSSILDPGNTLKLLNQRRARQPYFRGANQMVKPSFEINYPKMKKAIEDRMAELEVDKFIDVQYEKERVIAKIDAYHEKFIEGGWEYRPSVVQTLDVPKTKTAHYGKPGGEHKYVIRQGGMIVFGSDELEDINRQLGEAWVEECEYDDGRVVEVMHVQGREIDLGSRYMRPYGKTMLELRFPFYVRNRAT
jgi:hypothetical protein